MTDTNIPSHQKSPDQVRHGEMLDIHERHDISQRALQLLDNGENHQCDYKESPNGVSADDFVSFANCETGGALLLGIAEGESDSGQQIGVVKGCAVGDKERMSLMSKALSCSPPVQIHINIENVGDKPFFRIEIPSGSEKPYCTAGGTYKIRVDGRNLSLYPDQLLQMFLDKEGQLFRHRFELATQAITEQLETSAAELEQLEVSLTAKVSGLGKGLSKIISNQERLEQLEQQLSVLVHDKFT
jgi:predicted HTH transcriptional regulator